MGIYFSRPQDPSLTGWTGALAQSSSIAEAKQQLRKAAEGKDIEYVFLYDMSCLRNIFEMFKLDVIAMRAHIPVEELKALIRGDIFADNGKRIRIIHTLQKIGLELAEAKY